MKSGKLENAKTCFKKALNLSKILLDSKGTLALEKRLEQVEGIAANEMLKRELANVKIKTQMEAFDKQTELDKNAQEGDIALMLEDYKKAATHFAKAAQLASELGNARLSRKYEKEAEKARAREQNKTIQRFFKNT